MKKLMLFMLIGLFSISAIAQKINADKVPASVLDAFKAKFPAAAKAKWSLENPKEYEAEFKLENADQSASFSEDGKWIETEVVISKSQLPQAVINAIDKKYPSCKIEEVEQASSPENNLFYGVTVKLNGKEYDIDLKATGEIIKAVEVNEKD